MELLVNISAWRLDEDAERPGDASAWRALLGALESADLAALFTVHGPWSDEARHVPIGDLDQVAADAAGSGRGVWELRSAADEEAGATCRLTVHGRDARLLMRLGGGELRAHGARLVGELEAMLDAVFEAWPQARLGPEALVAVRGLPYARPRPPRALGIRDDAVLDWFDVEYAPTRSLDRRYRAACLDAAPPVGATRVERGRLVRVRWAEDLTDAAAVAEGLGRRQGWLASGFDGPIREGFNADGDLRHRAGRMVAHPPLSGHNPSHHVGYKKIPLRDGEVHAGWLEHAARWVAAGQLDDGTRLDALWLLGSDRPTALRLKPHADAIGAVGVLWVDKERDALWDPFPPGPWLEG